MPASHGARRLYLTVCAVALGGLAMTGPTASAANMVVGGLTSQPIGHYEFCKLNPAECSIQVRDQGPERMTNGLWSAIESVNRAVNRAVRPVNDIELFGRDEVWSYPVNGMGDCEDYVLEKRRQLAAYGVSLANLLITVVRKVDGEGHAVLTVRTDNGDYILDNLDRSVKLYSDTRYRYLKRQSSDHTGRWVTIRRGSSTLVGALN